uniref:Uncharacterized protein n=1 Tax=Microviridae sp. ct4S516 TaxID=2826726 RepID=A0A8S5MWL6_9VIRU|nr:MAG TPA: hypothetical protein [Microviridae sp. ct4S516]
MEKRFCVFMDDDLLQGARRLTLIQQYFEEVFGCDGKEILCFYG